MSTASASQAVAFILRPNLPVAFTGHYNDKYLAPLVTTGREKAAIEYVDSLGTIPEPWRSRLIVLRAYLIVCNESMKSADDIFNAKLKAYRAEYADTLNRARDAAERDDNNQTRILPEYSLSANLER